MDVSIVGLGKLGSTFAAVLASRGVSVYGCDTNQEVVDKLNRHQPTHYEPGLAECLLQASGNLKATTDLAEAVLGSSMTFILVPTPTDESGAFQSHIVAQVVRDIGGILDKAEIPIPDHIIVISSTVMPRTCRRLALAVGRPLVYCPEFIALGEAVSGFASPPFVVVGTDEPHAALAMRLLFTRYAVKVPKIVVTDTVSAEIAKVALNFWMTTKISFANQLARICDTWGGNVDEVVSALDGDPRINTKYMRAGGPYGGPCFPRDVKAFGVLEDRVDGRGIFSDAVHAVNRRIWGQSVDSLMRSMSHGSGFVGVLGLAFKSRTEVLDESIGWYLVDSMQRLGLPCEWYDPFITGDWGSAQQLVDQADVVFIANQDPEYKGLVFHEGQRIYDIWGQCNVAAAHAGGATLIQYGRQV